MRPPGGRLCAMPSWPDLRRKPLSAGLRPEIQGAVHEFSGCHFQPAALLGRTGLCAAISLRHGSGGGDVQSVHLSAGARPGAVAGGLSRILTPPDGFCGNAQYRNKNHILHHEAMPRSSPTTLSLGRAATTSCRGTACPIDALSRRPWARRDPPTDPLPLLPPHASLMDKHECYAKRVQPPSRAGLFNRRYYIDLSACKKRVLR